MNRITFSIGQGFTRDGKLVSDLPGLDITLRRMEAFRTIGQMYGGYTATFGKGGWISPSGDLVQEDSLTITVYTERAGNRDDRGMAQWLRELFNQEQVLLTIEPCQVEFISAEVVPISKAG